MRTLVVSHLYPNSLTASSGSFVHNQVRFLQQHCDVQVVNPVPWMPIPWFGRWGRFRAIARAEQMQGVSVDRPRYATLPRRILYGHVWRLFQRAVISAVNEKPDVIHAHCAYPDGLAAVRCGRQLRCPVVITVHGYDIDELLYGKLVWRKRVSQALRECDAVVCVSERLRQEVVSLGIPEERVHLVPNGVDGDLFRNHGKRVAGADGWKFLYVGRFDVNKGINVLLEAFSHIRRQRQDVQLTLVGGNPSIRETVDPVAACQRLGLEDSVTVEGEVPWDAIAAYMNASDVFVLPSFSEGLPLVLLEAMACGLPIVSTRCGGPSEIVTDEVGRLAEVRDVHGLSEAMLSTIADYSAYDRSAISERARRLYDYHGLATRLVELYERLLASPRG